MVLTRTATTGLRLSIPTEHSPQADVAVICEVFGIGPTSGLMQALTQSSAKTLHRAWTGTRIKPRTHLEVVADFAREVRYFMFQDPTWSVSRAEAMRRWLDDGEIELGGQTYRPRDVLSDDELARKALAELRAATD